MNEIIQNILNEEFLAKAEPQQAIVWFVPAIIAAVVAAIIAIIANSGPSTPIKGKTICVLGQPESGKTTFLNWLRYDKFTTEHKQTYREAYPAFEYKTFKIEGGIDIGGDNEFKNKYREMMQKNDICIFVFDACKFINDANYRKETWDRADLIYNHFKNVENRHTIGTHFDKTDYKDVNKLREKIFNMSESKPFKDMFHTNCTIVDLSKKDSFEDCAKRIFGV